MQHLGLPSLRVSYFKAYRRRICNLRSKSFPLTLLLVYFATWRRSRRRSRRLAIYFYNNPAGDAAFGLLPRCSFMPRSHIIFVLLLMRSFISFWALVTNRLNWSDGSKVSCMSIPCSVLTLNKITCSQFPNNFLIFYLFWNDATIKKSLDMPCSLWSVVASFKLTGSQFILIFMVTVPFP